MVRGRDSFAPNSTRETYKDVLIFEERLKQNAERLQTQKRKYEVFLSLLVLLILYLIYAVFIRPSIYSLVHYGNVTSLLISLVTLALFFATGMYSEKIAYAYKFVPQANRALRPFNIYLNTRTHPKFSKFSIYNFFKWPLPTPTPSAQSVPSSPTTIHPSSSSIPATVNDDPQDQPIIQQQQQPLSRRTSSSSSHSSTTSIRSLRGNRSPPSSPVSRSLSPPSSSTSILPTPSNLILPPPQLTILTPIPPASNPRGELIFSSRVSAGFREGYERYRGEWERRREEALAASSSGSGERRKGGWWRVFGIGRYGGSGKKGGQGTGGGSTSGSEKDRESSTEDNKEGGSSYTSNSLGSRRIERERERERGRSPSLSQSNNSPSSLPSSRQSSPLRLVNARISSRRNSNSSSNGNSNASSLNNSPRLDNGFMTLQEEESVIVSRVKLEAVGSLFVNRMNEGESNGLG